MAGITLATLLSCIGYYFAVTYSVSLQKDKLENLANSSLMVYDVNEIQITPSSQSYISVSDLNQHTIDAFVSAEDKRFYSHHGIDYLRIGSAMLTNIKTRSFSEGASTISQQLIKNTHLSNEKTINRKLKEIKLTKQLEKNYSKNEILEMYLNNIYFGGGAYGIENASTHYFGKSASKLTIAESALLAGTINAPGIYDIQNNPNKALERRNLILKLMKNQDKIDSTEYENAIAEELNLNLTKLSNSNYVYNEIIKEACKVLKKSENEIKNNNIKIYTYFDSNLNNEIQNKVNSNYDLDKNIDVSTIVIDNETNGIVSMSGSSGLKSLHQPGSAIKPILVYAPAIEEDIVSPATKLLDEKINYSGYSPENADKKYHGYVSVRDALKHSYNVPAVKLLNEIGIEKAQNFASRLGINFAEQDKNLAIALGGFTDGISLTSLCNAYTTFANGGNYKKTQFISKITQNSNKIYENSEKKEKVMKDSTAYLITDILKETSISGTAKRLSSLGLNVASKTGTVGKANSSKNTSAYNICYTTKHTILSFFGGDNMPENINGATYPTMLSKDILIMLYKDYKPADFPVPSSVELKSISKQDYKNNIVSLTENPDDSIIEVFSKSNLPKKHSSVLSAKIEVFNFENKKPIISFIINNDYSYKIIRKKENAEEVISSANISNSNIIKFEDKSAQSNEIYEYFVEFCENSSGKTIRSNSVKLKSF